MLEKTAGRSRSVLNRIILAAKRRCKSTKVLLARKDIDLSPTQSVGLEPTSRINDHGLAVRSNTIMGTLQVEPHYTVPMNFRRSHLAKMKPNWWSRIRIYDVSNVPDLQSGAIANYAYPPRNSITTYK